jgi:MinD superfamily P-loop ATPase
MLDFSPKNWYVSYEHMLITNEGEMVIAIASGKGGTGKTTVAVNLAISTDNRELTLIDCDVEAPNSHLFLDPVIERVYTQYAYIPEVDLSKCDYCGKCAQICRYKAILPINHNMLIFPELCHGCRGCERICPLAAISEGQKEIGTITVGKSNNVHFISGSLKIGEAMAPPLIRSVKKEGIENSSSEMIIIDAPPGTSCPVVTAIEDTDFVLLVTEPTPFGLHDLKLAVEMVRCMQINFGVIINRSTVGNRDVWEFCARESIPVMMEIPDDRSIAEQYALGKLIVDIYPDYRSKFNFLLHQIQQKVSLAGS